jgi:hypothetical protein
METQPGKQGAGQNLQADGLLQHMKVTMLPSLLALLITLNH